MEDFDLDKILAAIGGLLVLLRLIVALTPTPKDDIWLGKAYKVVELLALEFGKSKQLPGEQAEKTKPKQPNE